MVVNLNFPHSYKVEIDPELPGNGGRHEELCDFPGPSAIGRVGMVLRIAPNDRKPWLGRFWKTHGYGVTGVFACINKTTLCVIVAGTAYIIPVLDPTASTTILLEPVTEAHRIPGNGHMLFVGDTEMAAYDAHGEAWRTQRLSLDGLRVSCLDERTIEVIACDPATDTWTPILIDTATGIARK